MRVEQEPAQFADVSVHLHINFANNSPGQHQPVTALSVHQNVVSNHLPRQAGQHCLRQAKSSELLNIMYSPRIRCG